VPCLQVQVRGGDLSLLKLAFAVASEDREEIPGEGEGEGVSTRMLGEAMMHELKTALPETLDATLIQLRKVSS
jgi:hypothetical protein